MRAEELRRVQLQHWATENALCPSAAEPEHWPEAASFDNFGLWPLSYGDHSTGQSGVYAAVNALRLVSAGHHNWTDRDEQQLFGTAWDWQLARGGTRQDRGMRVGQLLQLADALTFAFARKHSQRIQTIRPWARVGPSSAEFFNTIERLIVSRQAVVGLFAGGHYSVIRGYTPSSLLLFDSGNRQWIKRSSVSLNGSAAAARHRIVPRAMMAFSRRI